MISYLARRLVTMLVTLLLISALVFLIIKLPPGDFLTNQIEELRSQGDAASAAKADILRAEYGLDRPVWYQYATWLGIWPKPQGFSGLLQGDWGWSFEYQLPVAEVVGGALVLTLIVNLATIIFIHAVAIPIAIYSATHRNTAGEPCHHLPRLYRPRDAELPPRTGAAVLPQPMVRHFDRRHDGPEVRRPGLVARQGSARSSPISSCPSR